MSILKSVEMKSSLFLKSVLIISFAFSASQYVSPLFAQTPSDSKQHIENSVSVTIDKNTSDSDFESIKDMLSEYDIDARFKNIKRNASKEITGITIELASEYSQASSTLSSSNPINDISFGSKNGNLYIGRNDNNIDMFAFFNGNNSFSFPSERDSIFGKHFKSFNLDDFFNGNSNLFMFNGDSIDIEALKDKFFGNFNATRAKQLNKSNNYNVPNNNESDYYQYNFVDDPDKDTLIVIDGKISDFSTLDNLAKANKLKSVDVLKSDTAMSIYGEKAKDGAIIAITK